MHLDLAMGEIKYKNRGNIMRASLWISIISLLLFLSLVACDGGSSNGSSPGAGSIESAPNLTGLDPEANDSSVLQGSDVTATFDMKMVSGSANTFVVYGSQTGRLAGIYSGDGSKTLRFDSNNKFKIGEEIEVTLTNSLTSTDGLSLELPIVYRFRTETLGGNGSFRVADTIGDQTGASALAAGDWDGDGDLDLAVSNFSTKNVSILENDPPGEFNAIDTISGQGGASALAAGDWDGDGDLDLAVAIFSTNSVSILENDPPGEFNAIDTISGQNGANALAAGDWDDDGDLDLAAAIFSTNTVSILENDPPGVFNGLDTISGQLGASALAVGDWDGDGDLDIAVANFSTNNVSILENEP